MKKLLYIGKEISEISSGADSVNHRNIKFLQQIFGIENIEFVALGINVLYDKIVGYLGGLNNKIENEIILKLKSQEYDYVFISHSCLGRLAKKIKRNFGAKIKIISFYHNIEKHYAKEYKRVAGIAKLPFLLSVSYNEKQCVFYSDYNIVLNERDSKLMQKYYNKKSDLILPVSYEDKFVKNSISSPPVTPIYLFVGTSFFANIQAVEWFIEKVLPYVHGKFVIVGNGMDNYFASINNEKVRVHGFVNDLSEIYYQNSVVVAPILSGGGMKTKVAEALMYGKTIVGTKEAFEGYLTNKDSMIECNTAEEFILALNGITNFGFNNISRDIFLEYYSNDSLFLIFKSLFK